MFALAPVALILALPFEGLYDDLQKWVESSGIWGPVALSALYLVTAFLMLPIWPLNFLAGAVFGFMGGSAVAISGTTGTAVVAFGLARWLGRSRLAERLKRHPRFAAIDKAVGKQSWKVVALVRLSKMMPFHLQNYLFGLTRVRLWPYTLMSALGMLPGTLVIVYIGQVGKSGLGAIASDSEASTAQWVLRGVSIVALIVAGFYLSRLARRAIAKADDQQADEHVADEPQADFAEA